MLQELLLAHVVQPEPVAHAGEQPAAEGCFDVKRPLRLAPGGVVGERVVQVRQVRVMPFVPVYSLDSMKAGKFNTLSK